MAAAEVVSSTFTDGHHSEVVELTPGMQPADLQQKLDAIFGRPVTGLQVTEASGIGPLLLPVSLVASQPQLFADRTIRVLFPSSLADSLPATEDDTLSIASSVSSVAHSFVSTAAAETVIFHLLVSSSEAGSGGAEASATWRPVRLADMSDMLILRMAARDVDVLQMVRSLTAPVDLWDAEACDKLFHSLLPEYDADLNIGDSLRRLHAICTRRSSATAQDLAASLVSVCGRNLHERLLVAFHYYADRKTGCVGADELTRLFEAFLQPCICSLAELYGEDRVQRMASATARVAALSLISRNNTITVNLQQLKSALLPREEESPSFLPWRFLWAADTIDQLLEADTADADDVASSAGRSAASSRASSPERHVSFAREQDSSMSSAGLEASFGAASTASSTTAAAQRATAGAPDRIRLSAAELSQLRRLRERFGLTGIELENIIRLFLSESGRGLLDREAFRRCVLKLGRDGREDSRDDTMRQSVVDYNSSLLFDVFDIDADGYVDLTEFVLGLCVLSKGDAMQKLRMGFNMFDRDRDGKISPAELTAFLTTYLRVLIALAAATQQRPSLGKQEQEAQVAAAVSEHVNAFFVLADTDLDGLVSFPEFVSVYKRHRDLLPWLDVMDAIVSIEASQQPQQDGESSAAGSSMGSPSRWIEREERLYHAAASTANAEEEDAATSLADLSTSTAAAAAADESEAPAGELLFMLELGSGGSIAKVEIRAGDVADFEILRHSFRHATAEGLVRACLQFQNEAGMLDRPAFARCVALLLQNERMTQDRKRVLHLLLAFLFDLLDATGDGFISAKDLLLTLTALLREPRTFRGRLGLAFALKDTADRKVLSQQEVESLLGAYLRLVLTIASTTRRALWGSEAAASEQQQQQKQLSLSEIVAAATKQHTESLFHAADADRDGLISFEQLETAIRRHPALVPWMEVLEALSDDLDNEPNPSSAEQKDAKEGKKAVVSPPPADTAASAAGALGHPRPSAPSPPPSLSFAPSASSSSPSLQQPTPSAPPLNDLSFSSPPPYSPTHAPASAPVAAVPSLGAATGAPTEAATAAAAVAVVPISDADNLALTREDVWNFSLVREWFATVPPRQVINALTAQSTLGNSAGAASDNNNELVLDAPGFGAALDTLFKQADAVRVRPYTDEHKTLLRGLMMRCFALFDRNNTGQVSYSELSAGMHAFFPIDNSAMLELAFRMLDSDGDGHLSAGQFCTFIAALLRVVLALNHVWYSLSAKDAQLLVSRAALQATQAVFAEAPLNTVQRLSFPAFEALIKQQRTQQQGQEAQQFVPWLTALEMLRAAPLPTESLRPSPPPSAAAATAPSLPVPSAPTPPADQQSQQQHQPQLDASFTSTASADPRHLETVFKEHSDPRNLMLPFRIETEVVAVPLRPAEIECWRPIAKRVQELGGPAVAAAFSRHASVEGGYMTNADYADVLWSLIKEHQPPVTGDEFWEHLAVTVARQFRFLTVVDPSAPSVNLRLAASPGAGQPERVLPTKTVETRLLASVVQLLSAESVEDKLALAFSLLDGDRDGRLTTGETFRLFCAAYAFLLGVSFHSAERVLPLPRAQELILQAAGCRTLELVQYAFALRRREQEEQGESKDEEEKKGEEKEEEMPLGFEEWSGAFRAEPKLSELLSFFDALASPGLVRELRTDAGLNSTGEISDLSVSLSTDRVPSASLPLYQRQQQQQQQRDRAGLDVSTSTAASDVLSAAAEDALLLSGVALPGPDGKEWRLEAGDLANLALLRKHLSAVGGSRLLALFRSHAKADGQLDQAAFNSCIAELMSMRAPGSDLDNTQQLLLQLLLSNLFRLFDRNKSGGIDADEFIAGLYMLCHASPRQRLSLAFMVVDTDGDGRISRLELLRFHEALLSILVGLSRALSKLPERTVQELVRKLALEKTAQFFAEAGRTGEDGLITLEEFLRVHERRPELVSWLSILDNGAAASAAASSAGSSLNSSLASVASSSAASPSHSAAATAAAARERKEAALSQQHSRMNSSLAGDAQSTAAKAAAADEALSVGIVLAKGLPPLVLNPVDRANIARLHRALAGMSSRDLLALVDEAALPPPVGSKQKGGQPEQLLSLNGVQRVVSELLPAGATELEREYYALLPAVVHRAFDRDGNGLIDGTELATALYMLSSGSKKQKVSFAFRSVSGDCITQRQLSRFIASCLSLLFALAVSSPYSRMSPNDIGSIVLYSAAERAASLLAGKPLLKLDDVIAAMGKQVPWLPEMDGEDPAHQPQQQHATSAANAGQEDSDDDEEEEEDGEEEEEESTLSSDLGEARVHPAPLDASTATDASFSSSASTASAALRQQRRAVPVTSLRAPPPLDESQQEDEAKQQGGEVRSPVRTIPLRTGATPFRSSPSATASARRRAASSSSPSRSPTAPPPLAVDRRSLEEVSLLRGRGKLYTLTPERVYDAFQKYADPVTHQLDRSAFLACVSELVPLHSLPSVDAQRLHYTLCRLFEAFDIDKSGTVDLSEMALGLSVFAKGTQREKLALAFRWFDRDNDGKLSREELRAYLRSLLSVMTATANPDSIAAAAAVAGGVAELVSRQAQIATDHCFQLADRDQDGFLDFDEFYALCEQRPNIVPWLRVFEVVDLALPDSDNEEEEEQEEEEKSEQREQQQQRRYLIEQKDEEEEEDGDEGEEGEDEADGVEPQESSYNSDTAFLESEAEEQQRATDGDDEANETGADEEEEEAEEESSPEYSVERETPAGPVLTVSSASKRTGTFAPPVIEVRQSPLRALHRSPAPESRSQPVQPPQSQQQQSRRRPSVHFSTPLSELYSKADVMLSLRVLRELGFSRVSPKEVVEAFRGARDSALSPRRGSGGCLAAWLRDINAVPVERKTYFTVLSALLGQMSDAQRTVMEHDCEEIFEALDRENDGTVQYKDCIAALTLIASGGSPLSAAEKLEEIFKRFDVDGDGKIDESECFALLRALLVTVSCLSYAAGDPEEDGNEAERQRRLSREQRREAIAQTARQAAHLIFEQYDANSEGQISVVQLTDAVLPAEGRSLAPWVEFLAE